jgi:phage shock protein A
MMALLERVSTLVRANLNDLIDKAEEPEKMIKQVILDMQNQLLQVKTQVAIAIADQHLLEKKKKENEDKVAEWMRKAELSVDKKQDDLARASLQRVESYRELSRKFRAAGGRPEGAGGELKVGSAATGAEADRSAGQG